MNQRKFTILPAAAALLLLLGVTALAAGDISTPDSSETPDASAVREEAAPDIQEEPVLPPDGSERADDGTQEEEKPDVTVPEYIPDPVGSISFTNLNRRMHEGNLQILALQENIDILEEIDYDDLKDELREALNSIAKAQWGILNSSSPMSQLVHSLIDTNRITEYEAYRAYSQMDRAYSQMGSAYDALREQFDAIKDGDMQSDNADTVRQLKNLQNQIVMAGEATYIALAAMEIQEGGLERQLTALDRQLNELDLRYELGHISSVTLRQAQAGRTALTSGLSTLRMNLATYKGQLELLLGADITGNISLSALPKVTGEELDGMDLERDLETAKANSWDLYQAVENTKDAKEAYDDYGGDYFYDRKQNDRGYMQARHSWYSAKYTYDNAVQNFELGLRNLYLKIQDYRQVLDAAKTALAVEQDNYTVAQLKRSQGTLSQNGFLEAEDKLKEAREKVAGAENDLFSAYHTYRWAVDYGILN